MAPRLSHLMLLSVAMLAPLPFGSVEAPWVTTWCVLLAISIAMLDLRRLGSSGLRPLLPFLALAAIFLTIVAAQMFSPPWVVALQQEPMGVATPLSPPALSAASVGTPWLSLGPVLAALMSF